MTDPCPQEASMLEAERTGRGTAALMSHLSGCVDCSEAVRVARFMGAVSGRLGEQDGPLPPPEVAWLKAELELRHERESRTTMYAAIRRAILRLAGGLALALLALWLWRSVDASIGRVGAASRDLFETSLREPVLYTAPVLLGVALMMFWIFTRPRLPRVGF